MKQYPKGYFFINDLYKDDYFLFIGYTAKATSTKVEIDPIEHQSYEWMTIQNFVKNNPEHILNEIIEKI
jgi:hypothetical protein